MHAHKIKNKIKLLKKRKGRERSCTGHSPHRASRYSQKVSLNFGPGVCVDNVTFILSTRLSPSPELGSLAASFGARKLAPWDPGPGRGCARARCSHAREWQGEGCNPGEGVWSRAVRHWELWSLSSETEKESITEQSLACRIRPRAGSCSKPFPGPGDTRVQGQVLTLNRPHPRETNKEAKIEVNLHQQRESSDPAGKSSPHPCFPWHPSSLT